MWTSYTTGHRQELARQLDVIGQEHNLLRKDLRNHNGHDSMLDRISTGENESIVKIQMAAEKARDDPRQFREQLETSKGVSRRLYQWRRLKVFKDVFEKMLNFERFSCEKRKK